MYLVPQTCVDYTIEGVTNLFDNVLSICKVKLCEELEAAGIDGHSLPLDEVFNGVHCHPFQNLRNAYQQAQFIKSRLPYVEPVEIKLGSRWITSKSGKTSGSLVLKEDKFVYIPILLTLQQIMQNKSIRTQILQSHNSSDGFLRDICDGWQSKEHDLQSNKGLVFHILAYFDEIEVCNALGSHTKVHKLGVFYFTLANFHPALRSKLNSIYLFGVIKNPILTEYGFNKVFQSFVDDMKQLTNGVVFTVKGQEMLVKGSLLLFLADTLAAHQLGGFKVGVGFSFRKCRNCLATADEIKQKFRHNLILPRTPELHDYHCSLLEGNLAPFNSTTYGINYRSCLNEIPLFNVADWQLPQDVMHVLLEGVLPMEIKLLLYHFTCVQSLFTVAHLNARIQSFLFGYTNTSTKPSTIDSTHLQDGHLHQSASQVWTLGRYLPLLIGDLIPSNNLNWECFLHLHDILGICMSPCISPATISYLSELIQIHHSLFTECYPSVTMTPKLHYMVHFPEQINRFGPLIRYWCMRMEAKNSYTKRAASCGNLKNVCLSFASRHQRLISINLNDTDVMSTNIMLGPAPASFPLQMSSADVMLALQTISPALLGTDLLHRPKWIKLGNVEYRPGAIIFVGFDGILPVFAMLKELFSIQKKAFIKVSQYVTVGLDEHYHSYIVSQSENPLEYILSLEDLIDYSVLHIHQSFSQTNNNSYICLKWNIEDINSPSCFI